MNKLFPSILTITLLITGCASPLDSPDAGPDFDHGLDQVMVKPCFSEFIHDDSYLRSG